MWRLPSWLINALAGRAYRIVSEELRRREAHTHQFAILSGLEEFGTSSQATLGRRLGIDRSDVVATLNELESRGLISRVQDETDRRRNAVKLTAKGRRELVRLVELVDGAQQRIFDVLSESERAELERLVRRVLQQHLPWRSPL
jgi:DNA-binding MarR family transcriptional regulator